MPIYEVSKGSDARQIVGDEAFDAAQNVVSLLAKTLEYSRGEFTVFDVLNLVRKGLCQLWIAGNGNSVMVTELVDYPQKRVCRILAVAGSFADFAKLADAMRLWAAANGAVEVEAYCRPSVARLARRYGFFSTQREQVVLPIKEMWQ